MTKDESNGAVRFEEVDMEVLRTLGRPLRIYYLVMILLFLGASYGAVCWGYQIATGLGSAGYRPSVMWGAYLVNFVFWIGIGHSGTLISAILFLFRSPWRTAINRSAEAMTIFAVTIAAMFPIIHLGRPWIFYWIIPYPNQRTLWPDFQSPLIFDFLAVSTYLTVSLLFWYMGLVPDLAAIRSLSTGLRRKIYGLLSIGWLGGSRQWLHYGTAYLLLAGLATALVISVHSIVSWDFALAIIPGYHSTIFAPYFVAGAIHSGLAMVLTLLIPLRRIFHFEKIITINILEAIAKTSIFMALIVGYSYGVEAFMAWYSGNIFERQSYLYRIIGYYSPLFWLVVICAAVAPLLFFFKKIRTTPLYLFVIAIFINIGMWFERFIIICGSMAHDYLPYQWARYWPNWVDLGITFGSFCVFLFAFLLFVKVAPSVSMSELKKEAYDRG